jgi:apolipoprotein N-acyltransferase
MRSRTRLFQALGLTVLSSALFALAFPPTSVRILAWCALVPYLVALRGLGTRAAILVAFVCGVLSAYVVGDWFPRSISNFYGQPTIVGVAFFLGVASVMVAPYYVAFAVAYRAIARRFRVALPLLAAAAWVAADLGRGRLLTGTPLFIGNPWALIGYSQVGIDEVVQVASVTGVYGISFAVVAVNATLAEIWLAARSRGPSLRDALRGLAWAGVAPLLVLAYGLYALRPSSETPPSAGTRIAIVQGNIDNGHRWRSEFYGRNLEVYLRMTRESLGGESPQIVFWPEAAMTFFVETDDLYRRAVGRAIYGSGIQLVAGGPSRESGEQSTFFNSTFLISERGDILARYDKQYLVPFSEYFPLRQLDFLRRRFERVRVFAHGKETPPLPTAAGPAGVFVCNEAMLPEVAGQRVAEGASYLINPSNDTWLGEPKFVEQQFDIASLRAVEQRRYLVRASTSGPSAIVDPWGRVVVATEPGERTFIEGTVHPRQGRSVYGRVGDLFALLCVGAVASAWLIRRPDPSYGGSGEASS